MNTFLKIQKQDDSQYTQTHTKVKYNKQYERFIVQLFTHIKRFG